ncbi:MAG: hypothetical protein H6Q16_242 [Bacteroidetes bacterium]|nr:hypothetical protein [Bacteroidota bacterium]
MNNQSVINGLTATTISRRKHSEMCIFGRAGY